MTPRIKVIADYPGSPFPVGTIIQFTHKEKVPWSEPEEYAWATDFLQSEGIETEYKWYEPFFTKFPHLFKRIEWYEDRQESEMPEYVRLNPENTIGGDIVFHVNEAKLFADGMGLWVDDGVNGTRYTAAKYFLPASESEYLAYKDQQKGGSDEGA